MAWVSGRDSSLAPVAAVVVLALSQALPACSGSPAAATGAATSTATTTSGAGGAGGGPAATSSTSATGPVTPVAVTQTAATTRFLTADHLLASVEMQLSGEPLAKIIGRDITAYSRDYPTPNVYFTPGGQPQIDLAGFSTAIESYEYSKQPMNNLALESGAGSSLAFGPLTNPLGKTGPAALDLLRARVQGFATESNAVSHFVKPVAGVDPANLLGWPGLWPTVHPYRSFDPTIHPTSEVKLGCSISSDDDPGKQGLIHNADYECDYGTLHLVDRAAQIDPTVTPGASGWAAWKYSLWIINYLQSMHDAAQTAVASVPDAELAKVGSAGNHVRGTSAPGSPAAVAGTFLGSSDIEGFQAGVMIEGLDNQAHQWLTAFTTTDGKTLSGFGSLKEALAYDHAAELRWFPAEIGVTEVADPGGFPRPAAYAVRSAESRLMDLLGLAGAYASLYALTDHQNPDVGGSQPTHAYFDGDPFADDDQRADGEPTLHDRTLAMLRVLVVNLDRLHRDPASGLLVDTVAFSGATPRRGATVDTVSVAYTLVALRTVRRSLGSQLSLYSNTTPDTAEVGTPLDAAPLHGAPGGATSVADRLNALIRSHAELLMGQLTTPDGHALAGWDVTRAAASSADDSLDAHAAAVRGLLTAYLATGDTAYRDRAKAVFLRMDRDFFEPAARIYTATPGDPGEVVYTPRRFAVLQGALRELYELLAAQPGEGNLRRFLEARLARLHKLVLNGWDDLNGDQLIDWPGECTRVVGGLPRGGLQMAERSLTGELGSQCDRFDCPGARVPTSDRDHDCVPEIDDAELPAALASEVHFAWKKK